MLLVTIQMIVGWAYSAMYFATNNAVIRCRFSFDFICSVITKGISLFDHNERPKAAKLTANITWWQRYLVQPIRNFVFQLDRDRYNDGLNAHATALLERQPR
jgi:hypothetical protein